MFTALVSDNWKDRISNWMFITKNRVRVTKNIYLHLSQRHLSATASPLDALPIFTHRAESAEPK